MSEAADKAGVVRNTAWSMLSAVSGMLLPILLTPFVVGRLGLERYGIWVVLNAVAVWLSHYDLGIATALTREVARRRALEDGDGLRRLWASWLVYDGICILLLFGAIVPASGLLSPALLGGERTAFLLLALQTLLVPVYRHLQSTLAGLQRLDRAARLSLLFLPLSAAGTVGVLVAGGGLSALASNGLFWVAAQTAILAVQLRRAGHPGPRGASREDLSILVSFGVRSHAGQLINQLFRSDRLLLALSGLPAAGISLYQFGAGLSERIGALVTELSAALPAAVSDLEARGDGRRVKSALLRAARLHAVAGFQSLGFAALFAPELLQFWLGNWSPLSVQVLRLLSVGALAGAVASPGHAVAAALGLPGRSALAQALGLGVAVLLYTGIGRRYDCAGLAASLASGWVAAQLILVGGLRRRVEFTWGEFAGSALLRPSAVLLPLMAVFGAWHLWGPERLPPGRWAAGAVAAPAFGITALLAWPLARAAGAIERDDVELLRSLGRRKTA